MPRPIETLAEEVLQLGSEARAKLLDRVVASLDADHARDAAWDSLAASREAQGEADQFESIDATLAKLRSDLE